MNILNGKIGKKEIIIGTIIGVVIVSCSLIFCFFHEKEVYYQVIFDSMGGSEVAGQNVLVGSSAKYPSETKREGYIFEGWYNDSTNGTRVLSGSSEACITADTTLYAHWKPNNYNITYDCNCSADGCSGNAPVDNNSYTVEDTNIALLSNPDSGGCAWSEHEFSGWECRNDTNNNLVSNGSVIAQMPASDVTCFASWAGAYHIRYACGDGASGDAPVDSNPYNSNSPWTLVANAGSCARPGYSFAGWKCNYNISTGTTYSGEGANYPLANGVITGGAGNSYGVNSNTSCTAVWSKDMVNVVFLEDEGAQTPVDQTTCNYGGTGTDGVFNLPDAPSKTGYTFTGWQVTYWNE